MPKSMPLGIRVEDDANDKKFMRFFDVIQRAAKEQGCVFFSYSGESHELINDKFDGEDLSGWLIPISEAEEFNKHFLEWDVGEEYAHLMRMAEWYGDENNPSIKFRSWEQW